MIYPAHIKTDSSGNKIVQTVAEHCKNSAVYALESAMPALCNTAYLAALLHDMGKFTKEFAQYIEKAANGEPVRRGSVNHTFAGVRFVLERWRAPSSDSYARLTSELLASAIGAHHGLFDCVDENGQSGFTHRLSKEGISYAEAREQFLKNVADGNELDRLFAKAEREIAALTRLSQEGLDTMQEAKFQFAMLARLLTSYVINADRRDTAEFMHEISLEENAISPERWGELLAGVEMRLDNFKADSEINRARQKISDTCREAAKNGSGIYRLNTPTGGGKTLSSLRYALASASEHGFRRITFVTPLLTVLEQNAQEIRKYIADDSIILEHHSNIIRENDSMDELNEHELLTDTWDSPVVITTLVQLLNTLFGGKTSSVRRMQSLAHSVIVIDEVQSVPRNMLALFNQAANFVSKLCGAALVLCSATQPALSEINPPIRYHAQADIMPYDAQLWQIFRRTEITPLLREQGYTIEELAEFAISCTESENSTLIICNTKLQANELYNSVKSRSVDAVFHLSTSMCMAHRIKTLDTINRYLEDGRKIICVSTQLVEAGVDFSFGCVIRQLAGMDNIVQAAGRCNRHGECGGISKVYIVNLKGESLRFLREIADAQSAARNVLADFERSAEKYENDLTSDAAIEAYYTKLYTEMPQGAHGLYLPKRETSMNDLLTDNKKFKRGRESGYILEQAFKTAGEEFKVFDENTTDVLVPYGEGERLIADLISAETQYDFGYKKKLLDKAKKYTVSLYDYELQALAESGGVYKIMDDSAMVLQPAFYSKETGFTKDGGMNEFLGY